MREMRYDRQSPSAMPSKEGWARKMNGKPKKNKKSCRQTKRGKEYNSDEDIKGDGMEKKPKRD